ncbi:hypothetical protein SynA1524_01577 [Synechococcus sp. A15-24]|nr:hypothetical protein SynA1524_01577 [Synechococcus sp. A15-24]
MGWSLAKPIKLCDAAAALFPIHAARTKKRALSPAEQS